MFAGPKRQNKLFAHMTCIKRFPKKSDKLLNDISSKTEIETNSNNFLL